MVKPDKLDESDCVLLTHDIIKRIEAELEYPGQIKSRRHSRNVDGRLCKITLYDLQGRRTGGLLHDAAGRIRVHRNFNRMVSPVLMGIVIPTL